MVKQWLNEYSSGLSGKSRQIARLRQLRLNGLRRWHVKEIVAVLPVLLQVASALFFAGLLVLLWQLNLTVAITATCLISAVIVFSVSTIILPSFTAHCSYLSPPSRALYKLTRPLKNLVNLWRAQLSDQMAKYYVSDPGWWVRESSISREMFRDSHPCMYRVWDLLDPGSTWVTLRWQEKELSLLNNRASELDVAAITSAYTTGMDMYYLNRASVCITELTLESATQFFQAIRSANTAHWGKDKYYSKMQSVHPCLWSGAIISLMDTVSQDNSQASPNITKDLEFMHLPLQSGNSHVSLALSHTRLASIDVVRIIHHYNQDRPPSRDSSFAEMFLPYRLRNWMSLCSKMGLGNDVRQQGECTTIRVVCSTG